MWGPYREVLLQAGALQTLLEAALAPTIDENCRKVIEKAAAVGIMYLCTVVSPLLHSACGCVMRPFLCLTLGAFDECCKLGGEPQPGDSCGKAATVYM